MSSLQNYSPGQKYLAIFLKNAHFQFLYFSSWKDKREKIVIFLENGDILPVGATMLVEFDLWTKILNLSLSDKCLCTPNSNYFSLTMAFQICTETFQNLP